MGEYIAVVLLKPSDLWSSITVAKRNYSNQLSCFCNILEKKVVEMVFLICGRNKQKINKILQPNLVLRMALCNFLDDTFQPKTKSASSWNRTIVSHVS